MTLTSPETRKHRRKLAVQAAYVERNRDKVYAACAEYAKSHREERAAYYREYRRRKSGKVIAVKKGMS